VTLTTTDDRGARIVAIDALRGLAIGAMIIYHFAWDLSYFGMISVDIAGDPWWTAFARVIAGTFVGLVGVSLALATRHGLRPRPFLRRLAIIIGAASLVTIGTWSFVPQSFVFFGILHLIAFASLAALPFLLLPSSILLLSGIAIFALPIFFTHEIFDIPLLWWVGLTAGVPINAIDYVPVFPWFAMTLFGIVAGRLLIGALRDNWFAGWVPSGISGRTVVLAGQWSLVIYLVHQLILVGTLSLVVRLVPIDPAIQAANFSRSCVTSCRAAGRTVLVCESFCGCVLTGIQDAGLLAVAHSGRMNAEQNNRWLTLVNQCRPTN